VFQELRRYGGLMSRPAVAAALASEKEALAKQVRLIPESGGWWQGKRVLR